MSSLAFIGAGYVGLVTGLGFASLGHDVTISDIDGDRIDRLEAGEVPFYEPGLAELLQRTRSEGRVRFTRSNLDAVGSVDAVFICVNTPDRGDGTADISAVERVLAEVAPRLDGDQILVIKSTVPPGTTQRTIQELAQRGLPVAVVGVPEFLREGRALGDFLAPDRIVIGGDDPEAVTRMATMHEGFDAPVVTTSATSAEMIKYASNAYLATRLTFVNGLANLCEAVGADIVDVTRGIGLDERIGSRFLRPGPGYGGSCFPKDTVALVRVADDAGYDFALLRAVIDADHEQRRALVSKVREGAGGTLEGVRVALWGVTFKANTDDTRNSPAIRLGRLLVAEGADVVAHDPHGSTDEFTMVDDPLDALEDAQVLLVATEWGMYAGIPAPEIAKAMKGDTVVDARNVLDPTAIGAAGLVYRGLGRA